MECEGRLRGTLAGVFVELEMRAGGQSDGASSRSGESKSGNARGSWQRNKRRHSTIGMVSPAEFERDYARALTS